jgi:hypothetical protein
VPLPAGAGRLFADFDEAAVLASRALLLSRLLEDGDSSDLRWLFSELPQSEIAAWIRVHGQRRLSRRSLAFWELVCGEQARPEVRSPRSSFWPL